MLRKAILTFLFTLFLIFSFEFTYSADTSESSLTTMGVVDK
jgi:hypothetical protein